MTRWKVALCGDVERVMPPGVTGIGQEPNSLGRPVVCLRRSALDCIKS